MTKPKRVRHNKKIVFAGKDQVWYKDGELQIYKGNQWKILANGTKLETYDHTWSALVGGDDLEIYDSTRGTYIGSVEDGVNATYTFKDYDGTVLKTGKVKDGETPTPPADPTRESTAQYTYTFAGWDPTVGPINKNTVYTATYTATVNQYTVTFVDEDGTTKLDEQTLDYGATPVYAGETPTKESTAQYTYTFSGWTPAITTVTGDATYTATYEASLRDYTVTIGVSPEGAGTVGTSEVTVPYGSPIGCNENELYVADYTIVATAGSGYAFSSWGTLPATVTENLSITATFIQTTTVQIGVIDMEEQVGSGGTVNPTSINLPIGEQYSIDDSLMPSEEGATGSITINGESIILSCTSPFQYAGSVKINDVVYLPGQSNLPNVTQGDVIRFRTFGGAS